MDLESIALTSAAMTSIGTAAGVWLVRPAMEAARSEGEMVAYQTLRKLLLALLGGGGVVVLALLTLAMLLKMNFFPPDFLAVVRKPLGAALWMPPIGIGVTLLILTINRTEDDA